MATVQYGFRKVCSPDPIVVGWRGIYIRSPAISICQLQRPTEGWIDFYLLWIIYGLRDVPTVGCR